MKSHLIYFFFSAITITFIAESCNNKEKYIIETSTFNNYLKNTFNTTIGDTQMKYVVFPAFACEACSNNLFNFLSQKKYKSTNIIATDSFYFEKLNLNVNNVFIDNNKKIDKLNLGVKNTGVIITKNKKIINIIEFNINDFIKFDSIFEN